MWSGQVISFLGVMLVGFIAVPALAQNNILVIENDGSLSGSLRSDGGFNAGGNNNNERRVGTSGTAGIGLNNFYYFELPDESALADDLSLEFSFSRFAGTEPPAFNMDIYGMGYVTGTTAVDAAWYHGDTVADTRTRSDLGTGSTGSIDLIFDNFLTNTSNAGRYEIAFSSEVKNFLQSLYDDGAVAGDYAVLRMSPDQIMTDVNITPATRGFEIGISATPSNRPYNIARLRVGTLPEVADHFGSGTNLSNTPMIETFQTGYGFSGGWMPPTNSFAASAESGRPNRFGDPEPIAVTTGLGTFNGGYSGVRITGDTGFVNSPLRRQLATPATTEVYFRYLIRTELNPDFPEAGFDSDDLVGIWLSDMDPFNDEHDYTQDGVVLGIRNGGEVFGAIDGTITGVAATISPIQDYLLIGRLYESSPGSGFNMLDFWLDPDSEDEAPLGTVALGINGMSSVTHVGFMTNATTELEDYYLLDHLALSGEKERIGFVDPALIDGDFNQDGSVNAADYVFWRDQLGDSVNYNAWVDNFGRTAGSGSTAAIPEPASGMLLLFGGAIAISRSRVFSGAAATSR